VSVVLPTHNRSAMLRDCMENGLFRQNYDADRWEIVLINDGSKDDTEAVVKELMARSPVPIRYFKLEGRGAAAARNFGMRAARGAIVAHIDDDARAVPGWLEAGVNQFKPGVAMVSGPIVADSTVTRGFFDYVMIMESDRGLFPTHNLLMRRDLALEEEGFDESFGANYLGRPLPGWDADLAYRILRKGYTHVFCEDAVTASFVFRLTWRQWFRELTKFQFQGRIVQRVPETRRGLAPIGGIVIEGRKRLYWLLSLVGIVLAPFFGLRTLLLTLPWLFRTVSAVGEDLRRPRRLPKGVAKIGMAWLWYAGSFIFVVYGAFKARKLLV
jgi:glycosyltransferase involved in cell wall biosynthesis